MSFISYCSRQETTGAAPEFVRRASAKKTPSTTATKLTSQAVQFPDTKPNSQDVQFHVTKPTFQDVQVLVTKSTFQSRTSPRWKPTTHSVQFQFAVKGYILQTDIASMKPTANLTMSMCHLFGVRVTGNNQVPRSWVRVFFCQGAC